MEAVIYGVIGTKPRNPYARAEQRGYELQLVLHEGCWEEIQHEILARKLQEFSRKYESGF